MEETRGREEETPRGGEEGRETEVYWYRWYILGVFALLGCAQSCVWSVYGPMDWAVKAAFGWEDSSFAMMTNWGNLSFLVFIFPASWLLEKRGLSTLVKLCTLSILFSLILRLIFCGSREGFTVSAHVGSFMNGASGTTIMSAPAVLSSSWFPPEERTLATSLAQTLNLFGNALSLVLGPRLVSDAGVNETYPDATPQHVKERIRTDTWHYFIYLTAAEAVLCIAIFLYYPSKPPLSPSGSGSAPRTDFVSGVWRLLKSKNAWLCALAYSSLSGLQGGWSGVQTLDFANLGIDDREAGNIGIVSIISSGVIGITFAFLADRFRRRYRPLIVGLLICAFASFVWFTAILEKFIQKNFLIQLYIANVLGSGLSFATYPLFFEYSSELLYPISEGEIGAFLTIFNNIVGSVFCLLFYIPNVGNLWMNYLLIVSTLIPIPAILLVNERYRRSEVDTYGSLQNNETSVEND